MLDMNIDATRILRVPGSINSKSGTRVSILEKHEYKYTFMECVYNKRLCFKWMLKMIQYN